MGRNYGHGKQMAYAGHHALREAYQGHHATVANHSERWGQFVTWCRAEAGIKDARNVDRALVEVYGEYLAEKIEASTLSVAYGQNLLSTVNVTMEILRDDRRVRVSPSALVGERTSVRTVTPSAMERETVTQAAGALRAQGLERPAAVLELARDFGLRVKEAALLDCHQALSEARERDAINVTNGTKGGRGEHVDRWVPITLRTLDTLTRAAALQDHARNLIPPNQTWVQFTHHLRSERVHTILNAHGLARYHDCRAAYACDRYQTLTGHPAPAVAGGRAASKPIDQAARETIVEELGHGRLDVVSAYVGSSR